MKISAARQAYYDASGTASSVARQAALAGIAIIWIFSSKTADGFGLSHDLMIIMFILVLMLLFDLLHYLAQAIIWGTFARYHEKQQRRRLTEDPDVTASPRLNWPVHFFFVGKFLLLLAGYILLAQFLWQTVRISGVPHS